MNVRFFKINLEIKKIILIFVKELKINDMFERRQFSDYDMALDYKERLDTSGYAETKIVKEFGKWYVYYKRY